MATNQKLTIYNCIYDTRLLQVFGADLNLLLKMKWLHSSLTYLCWDEYDFLENSLQLPVSFIIIAITGSVSCQHLHSQKSTQVC